MDDESILEILDQALKMMFSHSHNGYTEVSVLLLSWEDTDDEKIFEEIKSVHELFYIRFGFQVEEYRIPSADSGQSLHGKLLNHVQQFEKPEENLIILYYAGHGDKDPKTLKARWAAQEQDGPVLGWPNVQECVLGFEGDVLMILDCCCAALAARSHNDYRIHELLGASGPNKMTPPAGNRSFTHFFIQVVNEMLDQNAKTTVEAIYERLQQQERLFTGPVRFHWSGAGKTIELRPIQVSKASDTEITVNEESLALLSLNISLYKNPNDSTLQKLAQLARTDLQKNISEIHVEDISKFTSLQELLRDKPSLKKAILNHLRSGNQAEVMKSPRKLIDDDRSLGSRSTKDTIVRLFQRWTEFAIRSLRTHLILDPTFHSRDRMQELQEDSHAKKLGLSAAAELRLLSIGIDDAEDSKKSFSLSINHVKRDDKERKHNYPHIGNYVVYIEYHKYDRLHNSKSKVCRNVEKLSKLLALMPEATSSTLPYEGYVDIPHKHQFELVFRTPVRYPTQTPPFISLEEAYTRGRSMPFDERCLIAVTLVKYLHSLHSVGFCHRNLRPKNVVFLRKDNHSSHDPSNLSNYDLSRPRVLGLDISRSEDKIIGHHEIFYMHPDQWKKPHEEFSPIHDIYSLGVLLLEIGCWRVVSELDHIRGHDERSEDKREVSKRLIKIAQTKLLEKTGSRKYSVAVVSCLNGTFGEHAKDTKDPSKLQKAFESQVLVVLEAIKSGLW